MSSDDEQDDNSGGVFDQLKSIRPFAIETLYQLHQDDIHPPTNETFDNLDCTYHDRDLYQNLLDFEQLRVKLIDLKSHIKKLHKKTFDHADRVWTLKEESSRRIGMCQQGKIAETTFTYKQASMNAQQLDTYVVSFKELADVINKEYVYYSFESQMKRHKIVTQLSISYQFEDLIEREERLKVSIATLIDFLKHLGDTKSELVVQCRKWLRGLILRFIGLDGKTENYKFIIAQLSRGPVGTADWSADLISCRPFDRVSTSFKSVPRYISHCSALLSELFNSIKIRIRSIEAATTSSDNDEEVPTDGPIRISDSQRTNDSTTKNEARTNIQDQSWSLIDPRFSCSEELNPHAAAGNMLSECDVIKLCLRIPVAQIFRAYVQECLGSDDSGLQTDMNYQNITLRLLTLGTVIIKTYQIGLETFNSIQYGNLIEYLSSQIRRTVIVLSEQWAELKKRLKGVNDSLSMQLQVEYDNFILRSILIILELRQSGIWRYLSRIEPDYDHVLRDSESYYSWSTENLGPAFMKLLQVTGLTNQPIPESTPSKSTNASRSSPGMTGSCINNQQPRQTKRSSQSLTYEFSTEWFREVSEPMLWHILWQFYHNAFTSSCDYHSDNYWLQKFHEKSVTYLFVNKIRDSPPGECSYLLNSVTSMVLSRTRQDSKLITFVATEVFDLSFKHVSTKDKVVKKGIRSLIRCAEKFPNLISTYLSMIVADEDEPDVNVVELLKGCSLNGWLCSDDEFNILAHWLVECPITSPRNQVARLILSKLLLNSPELREHTPSSSNDGTISSSSSMIFNEGSHSQRNSIFRARNDSSKNSQKDCFVDLRLRRKMAMILYEACQQHLPQQGDISQTSLGASVEVAFGSLYCEKGSSSQNNILELCTETTYHQFYVWSWRVLFTLKLHILNQPETDWNDVQSRSGTSRSIKNTVLFEDSFHPVPSIQDSECLSLSEGVKKENSMASYISMLMTDITWRVNTVETCLNHLNVMAKCGHLTPSLMAMEFFTVCHLDNLNETLAKDLRLQQYFSAIVLSNFDSTRLASLIMCQLDKLKQYRQLQLSQFYIKILMEVAASIDKQVSNSWFSGDEHCLEKIACILDHIVKFNFSTQRADIIRKFHDLSYSIQATAEAGSWLGSLFVTNSINTNSTKREFLTTMHVLSQKYPKYTWLRWITTECDTLRLEKIWEDVVGSLSYEGANLDSAIKKVSPQVNASIIKSILPITSWVKQIFDIMETDLSHPLCPLIWYNFFLNYFANSLNGNSVGLKLVSEEILSKLMSRLDSLINYHLFKQRSWGATSNNIQQNSLAQLYKAYRLWLQDSSLRDAYVDIDRLKEDYLVPLLKSVMESSTEGACLQYIDIQGIENQNRNLIQVWLAATKLSSDHSLKELIFVENPEDDTMDILTNIDDEASDAVDLIAKPSFANRTVAPEQNRLLANAEDELRRPLNHESGHFTSLGGSCEVSYRTFDEVNQTIQRHFNIIFDESSMFSANLAELDSTKSEIVDLIQQLYLNKKREVVRVIPCMEGNECPGPARIKFEVEEATIDERKSQCIQDRRRQCEGIVYELLMMPSFKIVQSTVIIEASVKQLIEDPVKSKQLIESLLRWISEPKAYDQLNGPYHPSNHLLMVVLELMSVSEHVDTYNTKLVDVCTEHPGSVEIFSPFMSPSSCSSECFLELYKRLASSQQTLGPMAMFVMLSKFDVNSWLVSIKGNRSLHHELIRATCYALKCMGKEPDDSYMLTFELYKRHLHTELAPPDRRKPEEIVLVLEEFLKYMDEQTLAPELWMDFLSLIGLERRVSNSRINPIPDNISRVTNSTGQKMSQPDVMSSLPVRIPSLDYEQSLSSSPEIFSDISRFADNQLIFDYHSANKLMQMLKVFIELGQPHDRKTLLECYSDYLEKFSLTLTSVTFVWIKLLGDQYPDNYELIWQQFIGIWYDWVFLTRNCQNVAKTSYSLMASNFVSTLRFMVQKLPRKTQSILQSTLSTVTQYVTSTREVIYLELTILQRCLKKLNWSILSASPVDFENLASLSEQENFNMSDLVSHIMLQLNLKDSLAQIHEKLKSEKSDDNDPAIHQDLAHVSQRLATIIILQSNHLKGFRLFGGYFTLIPVNQVVQLASLILSRMEFANLEHSQTNKLLVNLLRLMCIKLDIGSVCDGGDISTTTPSNSVDSSEDSLNRSIVYAQFISNYLTDLIKNYPAVLQRHEAYLRAVIENSLQDLKNLVSPDVDMSHKTLIYGNLLECCSCENLDRESRLYIMQCLLNSVLVNSRPIVVMELFHAMGKIIRDGTILVFAIEKLTVLYLKLNGHYEKVLKSFSLKVLPSDIYLGACIEDCAPLALLVYFESLYRSGLDSSSISDSNDKFQSVNSNKIWSSFFHWISQLPLSSTSTFESSSRQTNDSLTYEAKITIAWLRLIDMLELNLQQFVLVEDSRRMRNASDAKSETESTSSVPSSSAGTVKSSASSQQQQTQNAGNLCPSHKSLIQFIKQLISIYDSSNSGGLWSYLKYSHSYESSRISLIALSVACFLSDRTLILLNSDLAKNDDDIQTPNTVKSTSPMSVLRDEILKYRKTCLNKLGAARRSKHYADQIHFIEALTESINQNDKVQYSEGVQLITTFVKSAFSKSAVGMVGADDGVICMDKILPTLK